MSKSSVSEMHTHIQKVTFISVECSFLTSAGLCMCLFLGESNSQMVSLTDELSQKNEELLRHQEEIAQLLSQIVELQHRVKEVRKRGRWQTELLVQIIHIAN